MGDGGRKMRQYLEDFFRSYEYPEDDAAVLLKAYDKIVENPEEYAMWKQAVSLYDESIDCDYKKIIEVAVEVAERLYLHEYTTELLIFICLSYRAKDVYKENGIDEEIFHANMLDLRYKLEECKLVKGIVGTFVSDWFIGFFKLTRFTLGRLQFEVNSFNYEYEKDGKVLTPESKVIHVHIPRTNTPLSEDSCQEAFKRAKEFFADQVGETCAFVCSSWLLYPENETIIPPHTNIYKFMKLFDIIRTGIDKERRNLWRFFDTDEKNPDKLPTDTSLRRAFVEHMKKGGKIGAGVGVFFF